MEKPATPPPPAYKRQLKLLVKIGLTALAIYIVYRQIDWNQLQQIILHANWVWLLPAFFLFLISKLVHAFRLLVFYSCINVRISSTYNIKLYLAGMFYNLFLPGGIGGDGYKIIVLKKAIKVSTRNLVEASLLDRVSGLTAIVFLALGTAIFSQFYTAFSNFRWFFWVGTLSVFPAYCIVVYWFFPKFEPSLVPSIFYSLLTQAFIYGSIISLLYAINVEENFIEYYALFMIAAIAASLPFTIGGIGIREAVLVYLPQLVSTSISKDNAVALSLLFLAITITASLLGAFFEVNKPTLKNNEKFKSNSI